MKYMVLRMIEEYFIFFYQDLLKMQNVLWQDTAIKTKGILYFLYKLHHSYKINKIIKLPLKNIWFNLLKTKETKDFLKADECIFLCFLNSYKIIKDSSYLKWLKRNNGNLKSVFLFTDIASSRNNIDIEFLRNNFDLLVSFDPEDSKKYGFVHIPHLVTYPKPLEKTSGLQKPEFDVYFLGKAKNRLGILVSIFKKLKENGLNPVFDITEVKEEEQTFHDEAFNYIDYIPYGQYLDKVKKTKCILEVMQSSEHSGYTARLMEAIYLNKKLLSNNKSYKMQPFFEDSVISIFSDENDIDIGFLSSNDDVQWNYDYSNYSVDALLEKIGELLK